MEGYLSLLVEWLKLHPHLAGLIAFLIAFVDSIPVVGVFLPGTILLSAVGTLMGAELVPLFEPIVLAIVGIVLGDVGSYWLGYYYQDRLVDMAIFQRHPHWLHYGEAFFKRYGAMAIFVGRYAGPIRCLTPVTAGMLRMSPVSFHAIDIPTAIIWAPTNMLPGIVLGMASLELSPQHFIYLLCVLIVIGLVVFLLIRNKRNRRA